MYLDLPIFTSSPFSLLATTKTSAFLFIVCTLPPNIVNSHILLIFLFNIISDDQNYVLKGTTLPYYLQWEIYGRLNILYEEKSRARSFRLVHHTSINIGHLRNRPYVK